MDTQVDTCFGRVALEQLANNTSSPTLYRIQELSINLPGITQRVLRETRGCSIQLLTRGLRADSIVEGAGKDQGKARDQNDPEDLIAVHFVLARVRLGGDSANP